MLSQDLKKCTEVREVEQSGFSGRATRSHLAFAPTFTVSNSADKLSTSRKSALASASDACCKSGKEREYLVVHTPDNRLVVTVHGQLTYMFGRHDVIVAGGLARESVEGAARVAWPLSFGVLHDIFQRRHCTHVVAFVIVCKQT